ncbi:MAG: FliI/YscN family ATPase [Bdellovibrionales bacterium]
MSELKSFNLEKYVNIFDGVDLTHDIGKVTRVVGFMMEGYLPGAWLGSICQIHPSSGAPPFLAEVVGFKDKSVLLMPLGEIMGVGLGAKIVLVRQKASVPVGSALLGRVLNGLGEPIDGKGAINTDQQVSLYAAVKNPLSRAPIDEPMDLGVRAINGMLTIGKGQRVGIMAGSGVGKSVLLGMLARNSKSDVNVIALIGERGREVREFIENDLGEEGLKRSVVIVATSDESPLIRMRGAFVATSIAEYFCKAGKDVLLMMDSVTRFAMAQREIGLSTGEPPATKGYTPSVFALLPKLLERAGSFQDSGSITGLYTVLVEGDDMDDPIADSVRSIVDGHIVLSRQLAQRGHFPAIDVLQSTSRVMRHVISQDHTRLAEIMRENMAVYKDAEDLINIGAYKEGTNKRIDQALHLNEAIESYLRQAVVEKSDMGESVSLMASLLGYGPDG